MCKKWIHICVSVLIIFDICENLIENLFFLSFFGHFCVSKRIVTASLFSSSFLPWQKHILIWIKSIQQLKELHSTLCPTKIKSLLLSYNKCTDTIFMKTLWCRIDNAGSVAGPENFDRVFKNYLDSSNSTQESYFKISHMLVCILWGKKHMLRVVLSNFLYLSQARSKRNINTLIFFCKKLFGG